MGKLRSLIWKELISIFRNPQMIASFVFIPIIFVAMGNLIEFGVEEAAKTIAETKIQVVLEDTHPLSRSIVAKLEEAGLVGGIHSSLGDVGDAPVILIIPRGFSESVLSILGGSQGPPPRLEIVMELESLSIAGMSKLEILENIPSIFRKLLQETILEEYGVNPSLLEVEPVVEPRVIVGGRVLAGEEANAIVASVSSSFFIVAMLMAIAGQYGALSMAQEKEDKTFETLLSQPVERVFIGVAKVVGALAVSIVNIVLFGASWYYYMSKVTGGATGGGALSTMIDILGKSGIVVFFAEALVAMMGAAMLGVILGGFARDTRTAGTFIGLIWMAAVLSGLALQIVGVPQNPVAVALMGASIILGPPTVFGSLIAGNNTVAYTALAATIAITAVILYILNKLLNSELLITGLGLKTKLRFRPIKS